MRRAAGAGVVAALVILGVFAATAFVDGVGSELEETEFVLLAPWNEHNDSPPATTVAGSCSSSSQYAAGGQSWRCITEDSLLFDPCYSSPLGVDDRVICPQLGTWGPDVVIGLTEPLPPADEATFDAEPSPWVVRLESGEWCYAIGGASVLLGDLRMNFECDRGVLALYGDIDTSGPVWTATALAEGETATHQVRVAKAIA